MIAIGSQTIPLTLTVTLTLTLALTPTLTLMLTLPLPLTLALTFPLDSNVPSRLEVCSDGVVTLRSPKEYAVTAPPPGCAMTRLDAHGPVVVGVTT